MAANPSAFSQTIPKPNPHLSFSSAPDSGYSSHLLVLGNFVQGLPGSEKAQFEQVVRRRPPALHFPPWIRSTFSSGLMDRYPGALNRNLLDTDFGKACPNEHRFLPTIALADLIALLRPLHFSRYVPSRLQPLPRQRP